VRPDRGQSDYVSGFIIAVAALMHLNKIPQNKNYFIIYSPLSC